MDNLNEFYKLRTEFTIIGLTGRVGAGCSQIASKLSDENFITNALKENGTDPRSENDSNRIKYELSSNFLEFSGNWRKFQVINYKDVLLLHLIHYSNTQPEPLAAMIELICQNGDGALTKDGDIYENRFGTKSDSVFMSTLSNFLKENEDLIYSEKVFHDKGKSLNDSLREGDKYDKLFDYYFGVSYRKFCNQFYDLFNKTDLTKRSRLTHDLALHLRQNGTVVNSRSTNTSCMFTIAETLNQLIKSWRKRPGQNLTTKIVIDAMKNSLELMYFKEKYSGFYAVATNKRDLTRRKYVLQKAHEQYPGSNIEDNTCDAYKHSSQLLLLDDVEYKTTDHKSGEFSSPDIENCIQKSDYHIYIPDEDDSTSTLSDFKYLSLNEQIIKMVALIHQPGFVTPSAIERCMQLAFAAKTNSGCISRQVGAAITDEDYSIKAIGWNEVPEGQVPCNLRSITNLVGKKTPSYFSDFEKNGSQYEDGKFVDKVQNEVDNGDLTGLNGRHCPFCFKSFHNAFEGKDNQVHTRSLHAEENAMMQIVKYGGQPIKGGNLFTTASPCELCSKKAFQLGIKNIFYIDPYPGIAQTQILKAGKDVTDNPNLYMYQGAVGRAFHKLYEPFMAIKDEMSLLTSINPKIKKKTIEDFDIEERINSLVKNENTRKKILQRLEMVSDQDKQSVFEKLISEGLS